MQERKTQEFEKKQRAVPLLREEIQKLKNEIASGMKVYGILEEFQF